MFPTKNLKKYIERLENKIKLIEDLDIKPFINLVANELFLIYREEPSRESWNLEDINERGRVIKFKKIKSELLEIAFNYLTAKGAIEKKDEIIKIYPTIIDFIDTSIYNS